MELLQLRYFFESAKNENFTKTAEKYKVPATSVSASVRRLERELGCELFHRSTNRIVLNEKGKRLERSLQIVFEELDGALDSLTSASADTREIRMLVRAMRAQVTDYIIEYKTKHPHVSFKTVFDFDDTDFESYDIIIDEKADTYRGYESSDLYTATVGLKVCASSPLCGKKLILKQLSSQPFISIGENNGMHKILMNACKRAGFVPNIVVQSNDLRCIEKCVAAGVGIGLGRRRSRKTENVEYLDVSDFCEKQTICVYYKKKDAYGNVEHFCKFLKGKMAASSEDV